MGKIDPELQKRANTKRTAGLPTEAQNWPTPAARDAKGENSLEHCTVTGGGRKHMDQLSNFVSHSSHQAQPTQHGPESSSSGPTSPRRLNPAFTEWLMGWPTTWTTAAPSASSAAATESWRRKHRSLLSDLCGGCANENALPDLQQADAQTGCDIAPGRNRPGLRREGCAAPTPWTGQENSADNREAASAGCL